MTSQITNLRNYFSYHAKIRKSLPITSIKLDEHNNLYLELVISQTEQYDLTDNLKRLSETGAGASNCDDSCKGLSVRDVNDVFCDGTGPVLLLQIATGENDKRVWADYRDYIQLDRNFYETNFLYVGGVIER